MDDIQIPGNCTPGQFQVMLKTIDMDTVLSPQDKQYLKSKFMEKYMLIVAKNAVREGSSTKVVDTSHVWASKRMKLDEE